MPNRSESTGTCEPSDARRPTRRAPVAPAIFLLTLMSLGLMGLMGCRRDVELPILEAAPGEAPAALSSEGDGATDEGGSGEAAALPPTAIPDTPTPTPTRAPPETTAIYYTVRPGDNLLRIALQYGTTVETLIGLNDITNADQLSVGDVLQVSMDAQYESPDTLLIPDSELVLGPGYADFDTAAATAGYPGHFNSHSERVNGREMTAPEIVELIAREYSVGPRVLLTMLEVRGQWLSRSELSREQLTYPLGFTERGEGWGGLYYQLSLAADSLNGGFYNWWEDTAWLFQLGDGTFIEYSSQINAGTAGVQRALGRTANSYEAWLSDLDAFARLYREYFGSPFDYAVEPLIPATAAPIALTLPWPEGETWYYTGGPHPGWGSQGPFAAVDFATDEEHIGCAISQHRTTAAAPGRVVMSENGMVLQDADADGFVGTGWVLVYMHIASDGRAAVGDDLAVGDPIGHPSCEGGISSAAHLHFARRLNGVWIPADDANWPMSLSGWVPGSADEAYEGTLTRDGVTKTACECWDAVNAVRH